MNTCRVLFVVLYIANLICLLRSYPCCDNTQSSDCTCSDQIGGIGTCNCNNSSNTRQGWLCKNDSNGDSVCNINLNLNKLTFILFKTLKVSMLSRQVHGRMWRWKSYMHSIWY